MTPKKIRCSESGKKSFPTMWHAEIRAAQIQIDTPLYAYRCPHCAAWHLTKQPVFETILLTNLALGL